MDDLTSNRMGLPEQTERGLCVETTSAHFLLVGEGRKEQGRRRLILVWEARIGGGGGRGRCECADTLRVCEQVGVWN